MTGVVDSLTIRKATKKDFDSILNLANQLYKTEQPFDKNIKDGYYQTETGKKELLKAIQSRKKIFLVATIENSIVGYINGFLYDKEDVYIKKVAYLDQISVDNNYRHKGIGTKLIDAFTAKVKEKGAKYIKLNAFENNEPAIHLYSKKGFDKYSIFYMKKIN